MPRLKIASITALMIVATSALADPLLLGAKGKRAPVSSPPAGAGHDGYYAPYIIGADGRKYPIMEIPGGATVITRQVIDDQQATTLGEALKNVSGVMVRSR
ncbi:TonB-dependent receptor plug domain-containing protein [Methylocystis bryophila]|uniref:TonB-dependent receptor plug domain-containing protein n=1 Tax=Methylocystis bryophila TaxID=655015 RepID=A0A1W6N1U5_9HYPH|nr:Plug domain-containing protein [Methylocystis bryophila]ARN83731.1 hypothetical protein B1812_16550 [Methylocystis bryophila]BDV38607.1 hypothetical protein DSM21852_18600 [Methylocystis bryophila]